MKLIEVQCWEGNGVEPEEFRIAREAREAIEQAIREAAEAEAARKRAATKEQERLAKLEHRRAILRLKSVWTLSTDRVEVKVARNGWECHLSPLLLPRGIPIKQRFRRLTIVSPTEENIERQMPYGFTFENPIIVDLFPGVTGAAWQGGKPPWIVVSADSMKPLSRLLAKKWSGIPRDKRTYSAIGIQVSVSQRQITPDMSLEEALAVARGQDWDE